MRGLYQALPPLFAPLLFTAFLNALPLPSVADAAADVCSLDGRFGNAQCTVRDLSAGAWIPDPPDGPDHLHHHARRYADWLHRYMLPAGGVMRAAFADANLDQPVAYGGRRDPAIWTGAYLAAEALRSMATGSDDAAIRVKETVRVLDRWWRIAGDAGYLARYAAPEDSPQPILDALTPEGPDDPPDDPEVHLGTIFEDMTWRWRSQTSRDQYQGVLLGYSLAYEATEDSEVRELIREGVVAFAEHLQEEHRRTANIVIDGTDVARMDLVFQHVVFTDDETADGAPILDIDLETQEVAGLGVLVFWPNPAEFIRQIPGFDWVPDVGRATQAIQLAAAFRVALQVTEGVPGWEDRHRALRDHYESHVDEWLDIASDWRHVGRCGDDYFGINIGFMPLFTWARLETDPLRRDKIRSDILRDRMWAEVEDHKNVFFAFLYAAEAPHGDNVDEIVASHREQLAQFPSAPNLALPRDLTDAYLENPLCPGLSTVAIDVGDRVPTTFIWERHPWKLEDPGTPNYAYPGIDFLLAYWLGRHFGFIDDDAAQTATRWRTLPPPTLVAGDARQLVIPSVTPTASGAAIRVFYLPVDPADETLSGLAIRMHWDSFAVRVERITDALPQGLRAIGSPQADILDLDGNPATDHSLELIWVDGGVDAGVNAGVDAGADTGEGWPGAGTTPAVLFMADLDFVKGFAGVTSLGFSAVSEASGYVLAPWRTVIDSDGASMHQVQKMYVGYYGRPGDPAGLAYWAERLRQNDGNWTGEIADAFGNSPEYLERFGELPPDELIDNLYLQLFNRLADPVGKAFYLDLLTGENDSGLNPGRRRSTLARIALDIANGAQNEDVITLSNKLDVAAYFTELVDQNDCDYQSQDIPDAVALLAPVDDVPSTVVWQMLAADGFVSAQ